MILSVIKLGHIGEKSKTSTAMGKLSHSSFKTIILLFGSVLWVFKTDIYRQLCKNPLIDVNHQSKSGYQISTQNYSSGVLAMHLMVNEIDPCGPELIWHFGT